MQLPSTGPLKLAIRRQRNRLKLRTISQIQICRFSITEREDSPANSQHSQVQACRQGYPPKCNFVRYLCGINIAWNPWGRKYDIVKKKTFPNCISKRNPEASGDLGQKTAHIRCHLRHLPHSRLQFFAIIADVGARLCGIPRRERDWRSGGKCGADEV
jgi:hypothetical protein